MSDSFSANGDTGEMDDKYKKNRKSTAGRKLMRWNAGVDQQVLLCVEYVCNREGIAIPWDKVGAEVNDFLSGEAIKQHLAKVRASREEAGDPVPPKPEKGSRRKTLSESAMDNRSIDLGVDAESSRRSGLLWGGADTKNAKRNTTKGSIANGTKPMPKGGARKKSLAPTDNSIAENSQKTNRVSTSKISKGKKLGSRGEKGRSIKEESDNEDDATNDDVFDPPLKKHKTTMLRALPPVDYSEEVVYNDDDEEDVDQDWSCGATQPSSSYKEDHGPLERGAGLGGAIPYMAGSGQQRGSILYDEPFAMPDNVPSIQSNEQNTTSAGELVGPSDNEIFNGLNMAQPFESTNQETPLELQHYYPDDTSNVFPMDATNHYDLFHNVGPLPPIPARTFHNNQNIFTNHNLQFGGFNTDLPPPFCYDKYLSGSVNHGMSHQMMQSANQNGHIAPPNFRAGTGHFDPNLSTPMNGNNSGISNDHFGTNISTHYNTDAKPHGSISSKKVPRGQLDGIASGHQNGLPGDNNAAFSQNANANQKDPSSNESIFDCIDFSPAN